MNINYIQNQVGDIVRITGDVHGEEHVDKKAIIIQQSPCELEKSVCLRDAAEDSYGHDCENCTCWAFFTLRRIDSGEILDSMMADEFVLIAPHQNKLKQSPKEVA